MSNVKQKGVAKQTEDQSEIPGERIHTDTSSIKHKSVGGNKHWLGIVDDETDKCWSHFMKRKNNTAKETMEFLRKMKAEGTPVKCVWCNNTGENGDLQHKCKQSAD